MMRFHTALSGALAAAIFVPSLLSQAPIATLKSALSGTDRALGVLHGLEQRLQDEPTAALGLILSATEPPAGTIEQREEHLETLRNEVNLLQMQLDSLESPVTGSDGEIAHFLGTAPLVSAQLEVPAGITTGLDDSLRSALGQSSAQMSRSRSEPFLTPSMPSGNSRALAGQRPEAFAPGQEVPFDNAYSADPLRHGIACFRAGRYDEAYQLLRPLDEATPMYWRARVLERLNKMDEATDTMEKAILKGGDGFDMSRAQTDLEFLRWKRQFLGSLPEDARKRASSTPEDHR